MKNSIYYAGKIVDFIRWIDTKLKFPSTVYVLIALGIYVGGTILLLRLDLSMFFGFVQLFAMLFIAILTTMFFMIPIIKLNDKK